MTMPLDHPPVRSRRIGLLLVNLGTPEAPEPKAVRRYLAQFLSDPRVVEIPQIFWQPILRGIILNVRPKKSAHAYRQIWTDKGSPLAAITRAQGEALADCFGGDVEVRYAMRYGRPSIDEQLVALRTAGCDHILVAPLYPQYCAATTATVIDAVGDSLKGMRWQPAIRTLPPYHDDPAYIEALAQSVREGLATIDFEPHIILASFHGMPARTLALGDPYHCQCLKTSRLLSEALGRPVETSFQSRFGRAKWLEPYTESRLAEFPGKGVRNAVVIAPGFSADCLETLEEIAIRGRELFLRSGGENFAYLPCLNDSPAGIAMLRKLLARELAGWVAAA